MPVQGSNESRDQKFKRLAASRTNSVLDKLRLLGNMSNRHLYSYSQDDVSKIFSTIEKQLKEIKVKFHFQDKRKFKL